MCTRDVTRVANKHSNAARMLASESSRNAYDVHKHTHTHTETTEQIEDGRAA